MKIGKKLSVIGKASAALLIICVLYAFKAETKYEDAYHPQQKWENLKVLPQNISKDSLTLLMKNYTMALGVDCTHCHVPSKADPSKLDFANDDKIEKEIARGMIEMTNDLNETIFKPHFPEPKPKQVHVVNCVMCHRGAVNPEKYLSQMGKMYKTYDPDRDNRKEKILELQNKN